MKNPIAILILSASLSATPIFTNTGSASTTCFGAGIPQATVTQVGPAIDLQCPAGSSGAGISGIASSLTTQATVSRPVFADALPSFSFTSAMDDTITEPGNAAAIAHFTLVYDWFNYGGGYSGRATTSGSFWFNGQLLWSRSDPTCLNGQPCWNQAAFGHTLTLVFDEPITQGVPFSYRAQVSTASMGEAFTSTASNSMTLSVVDPVDVPEPGTGLLMALALMVGLWRRR